MSDSLPNSKPAAAESSGQEREIPVVRIRLGAERPAPQPDPLGRIMIGYAEGLSTAELWERGRGVWKAKLSTVAEAELAILVVDDVVRLIGTVRGVDFHAGRVAVVGDPVPDHPLVGQPDPLTNESRNPIAYGTVRTVPVEDVPSREYETVLADAIRVLSEAARLRRQVLRPVSGPGGRTGWEPHPTQTELADWAEFVTLALAGAAANVGGVETALAGRPGSWEAEAVRRLLVSTVGEDEADLWRHRTEWLRIRLAPDLGWLEELYDESRDLIAEREEAVRAGFDASPYEWVYRRAHLEFTDGHFTGDFVCEDPEAPAWPEALERFREDLRRLGADEEFIAQMPSDVVTSEVRVSKSDEAREEIVRLEALADEAAAPYERVLEALAAQEERERSDYLTRLKATISAEATRRFPGAGVEFSSEPRRGEVDPGSEAEQLLEYAERHTPLPGSGTAPVDYRGHGDVPEEVGLLGDAILAAERAAGRLPHHRLPEELVAVLGE